MAAGETYPDAIHPQLLATEDITAEDAAVARSNALAALLDHEGVMADIRGITLSNNAAMRLQVRDVERSLSALRPADALAPESVRQQLADLEARGTLPLDAFRQAAETTEQLQRHARETLNDQAPDFSRLTQLLALLPGAVQSTTPEILPQPQAEQPENATIDHTEQMQAEQIALPVRISEEISPMTGAEPRQIRDRNACVLSVAGLSTANRAARPFLCCARQNAWSENASRR